MENQNTNDVFGMFGSVNLPDMRAPIDIVDIQVDFSKGLWQESASMFTDRINSLGHDKGIFVDTIDFERYLTYLLAQRIWMTTGKKYEKRVSYLYVPSLFAIALLQIGKAYDKELGINYIPVFNVKDQEEDSSKSLMTYEEAETISNKILLLQDEGFKMERGLPRDRRGTVEFLTFQYALNNSGEPDKSANVVAPSATPHIVYAMLITFFKVQQINSVFNPRVKYGMINEYHQLLRSLINVAGS